MHQGGYHLLLGGSQAAWMLPITDVPPKLLVVGRAPSLGVVSKTRGEVSMSVGDQHHPLNGITEVTESIQVVTVNAFEEPAELMDSLGSPFFPIRGEQHVGRASARVARASRPSGLPRSSRGCSGGTPEPRNLEHEQEEWDAPPRRLTVHPLIRRLPWAASGHFNRPALERPPCQRSYCGSAWRAKKASRRRASSSRTASRPGWP